jgi:hypothetical protein
MASLWRELNKWQQRAASLTVIGGLIYVLFTTFRAGVSFPIKQEVRLSTIEGTQMTLSNKIEEVIYKQDQQHDLLIRIEERLWPDRRRVADFNQPKTGNIQ